MYIIFTSKINEFKFYNYSNRVEQQFKYITNAKHKINTRLVNNSFFIFFNYSSRVVQQFKYITNTKRKTNTTRLVNKSA